MKGKKKKGNNAHIQAALCLFYTIMLERNMERFVKYADRRKRCTKCKKLQVNNFKEERKM